MSHKTNKSTDNKIPANVAKKEIYYDGLCTMCNSVSHTIDNSKKSKSFAYHDINKGTLPSNLSKSAVTKEIHVIGSDGTVYKNVDAIFQILEEYPYFKWLVKVGKLPVIKQFLGLIYKIVAANRHFILGPSMRVFWLRFVLGISFISGILLSFKLWTSNRYYPLSPVFHSFVLYPLLANNLIYLILAFLALTLLLPRPRSAIFGAAALLAILVLADQSRLQPWVYQYTFMLIALGIFSWRIKDKLGAMRALNICRLIIAATYIYSGLQKFNPEFPSSVFPWMIQPITNHLPQNTHQLVYVLGVLTPLVELSIGVGLLSKKLRKSAVILAILLHVSILATIGPFGHNWNSVVWPWNIAMILFDLILFWNVRGVSTRQILWPKKQIFQRLVFLLFVIMPFFSFFNLWDSYLSSTLYSGNTNGAIIYVSASVRSELPEEVQQYAQPAGSGEYAIYLTTWSFGELNVPTYPETRVFKQVDSYICEFGHNSPSDITLSVSGKPTLFRPGHPQSYWCAG